MTKYRVKTKALKEFEYGQVLTEPDNDEWYYNSDGFKGLKIDVIKRNPDWFEKIETEFRVGEYVISDNLDVLGRIVDVDELDNLHKWGVDPINGGIGNWEKGSDLRHATDNEIEQALAEEAKRRDLGVGVVINNEKLGYRPGNKRINNTFVEYLKKDALFIGGQCIYKRGKFAEIIEDEWEVKWGGMRINADINQSVKMGMAYWYVTDGDTDIKFDGMSEQQSKAIAKALNKL